MGLEVPRLNERKWTMEDTKMLSKSNKKLLAIGVLVIAVVLLLGLSIVNGGGGASVESKSISVCKDKVISETKDPTTTEILSATASKYKDKTDGSVSYFVSGQFRAVNGFGAMLTGNYTCVVYPDNDYCVGTIYN